jgi:hypothetical protein
MKARMGSLKMVAAVLLAFLAVLGVAFFALLEWGQTTGSELQESFFTAVDSGEANKVTVLLHPTFREVADKPVLEQWMAAVKTGLGEPKGFPKHDFVKSSQVRNGVMFRQTDGNVSFAKGRARSELEYRDWQITSFRVTSQSIPSDWRHEVPLGQTPFYRERGKAFFTHLMSDEADDAVLMMSESLQKETPLEKLKELMKTTAKDLGKLKSVECVSEEAAGPARLRLLCRVEGEKATMFASAMIEREGFRCPVVAFQMNEKAPASMPATTPASQGATAPASQSTTAPASRPAATPTSGPAEKPATAPAGKP